MKRVLIIGLVQRHHVHVRRAFRHVFDLRFNDSDQSAASLARAMEGHDAVIVLLDFVDHARTTILRSAGIPWLPVRGSTSALLRVMVELSNGRKPAVRRVSFAP